MKIILANATKRVEKCSFFSRMIQIFIKGGPVMWPLLVTSVIALTVVFERLFFILLVAWRRDPRVVEFLFSEVEVGNIGTACTAARKSRDFVARALTYALEHSEVSFSDALMESASRELRRFNRGISILDTIITLAPLLGLLGTVIGMIQAFGMLGANELGAPTAITGGIAEALIATAFGLLIAILALIPFNFLNSRLEQARQEIETSAAKLELLLMRSEMPKS